MLNYELFFNINFLSFLDLLIKELTLFKEFIDTNADYYFELKSKNKDKSLLALLHEDEDD